MYALFVDLITGMLCFQYARFGEWVYVVVEPDTIIKRLGILTRQALVLWEAQVVMVVFFKIVLCVALCAYQASHLLV